MINPEDIHLVYWSTPNQDATDLDHRLVGKFLMDGKVVHVLSDYFGLLHGIDGPVTAQSQRYLDRLHDSTHFNVVTRQDLDEGKHPELAPKTQEQLDAPPVPSTDPNGGELNVVTPVRHPVFDYHRVGMERPHTVEFRHGQALLDGNLLTLADTHLILDNVKKGLATLRYKKTLPSPMQKAERFFESLHKAEGLAGSLDAIKALVSAGHLPQEHFDRIRRELYEDEMAPGIGNKRAYNDHLLDAKTRGGVHIMLDGNDFKSINDELSHSHGDQAISALGGALRRAMDGTVGAEVGKIHRTGGDEFHAHVPTHEHAATFLRALRGELESIPAVGGTHKLSMSAGLGSDPHSADLALNNGAKGMKKQAVAALGGDPTARVGKVRAPHALYAHSSVPGFEGAVPMSHDQLPINPPTVPKMTPVASAAPKPEPAPAAAPSAGH